MSKAPPPLLGFNNNVRHRGRIFHIQTEDSGVKFPRIVTHLFADGGRIVKTTRTDYTEHLPKADMAVVVRGMMKEQHKAMFAALRAGDLDHLLEKVCGPLEAAKPKAVEPETDITAKNDLDTAKVVVGARATMSAREGAAASSASGILPAVVPPAAPAPAAAAQAAPTGPLADARTLIDSVKALPADDAPAARRPLSNPNLRKPTPSVVPPRAEIDLDVASLDKNPPPRPPRSSPTSVRPPRSKSQPAPRKSRPPIPARPGQPAGTAAAAAAAADQAAVSRPATRLAAVPQTNARSIFGDGAISEQSLDEVILSYLAEDLEEPKP